MFQVRYDANLIPLYTLSEDIADGALHVIGITGTLVAAWSLLTEAWSRMPEARAHRQLAWRARLHLPPSALVAA